MFETNKQVIAIADTGVKIIHHKASFLQYKQLRLNNNFRWYLERSILARKVFRMTIQKHTSQKPYELSTGIQFYCSK